MLFDLCVSQLTKQSSKESVTVAFLREYVYEAFKSLVGRVPEESVENMLTVVSTPTQYARSMLSVE